MNFKGEDIKPSDRSPDSSLSPLSSLPRARSLALRPLQPNQPPALGSSIPPDVQRLPSSARYVTGLVVFT